MTLPARRVRSAPTWHNLQTSVRTTDEPWTLPEPLASGDGPLVYLSLGSLGSGDVELMQPLIDSLTDSRHRVIVSMGAQHEQLRLGDNMTGAEFLPQTSILPQVDAVLTHGGNNTVTECLYFGKPMVVLPLFWDQYDNAQRIHETGLGVRLSTYGCEAEELTGAVDRLLGDAALRSRLAALARRLQDRSKYRGRRPGRAAGVECPKAKGGTSGPSFRDQQRDAWDRVSAGWKKWDELVLGWLAPFGAAMIRRADLRDDSQVLDVAAEYRRAGAHRSCTRSHRPCDRDRPRRGHAGRRRREPQRAEAFATSRRRSAMPGRCRSVMRASTPSLCPFGFMFFPDIAAADPPAEHVAKAGRTRLCRRLERPGGGSLGNDDHGRDCPSRGNPAPPPGSPGLFRCAPEGFMHCARCSPKRASGTSAGSRCQAEMVHGRPSSTGRSPWATSPRPWWPGSPGRMRPRASRSAPTSSTWLTEHRRDRANRSAFDGDDHQRRALGGSLAGLLSPPGTRRGRRVAAHAAG